MKLSLRDKKGNADVWNPESDIGGQTRRRALPGYNPQPAAQPARPGVEELQRTIAPRMKFISQEKISGNRVKKVFEEAGRKFYQLFDNSGKMIYDSRKASMNFNRICRASIVRRRIVASVMSGTIYNTKNYEMARQQMASKIKNLRPEWSIETIEQYMDEPEIQQEVENLAINLAAEEFESSGAIENAIPESSFEKAEIR